MVTSTENYDLLFLQCDYLLDDAGAVKPLAAMVLNGGTKQFKYWPTIVKLHSNNDSKKEYTIVAVHSYLDVKLSRAECCEIAIDWLCELGHTHIVPSAFYDK